MFFNKRYIRDYSQALADKHGLTPEQVQAILCLGLKNLVAALRRHEEITIRKLFTIYLNKRARAREVKKWNAQRVAIPSTSGDAS